MTETPGQPPAANPLGRSAIRRAWNWFWRGDVVAELHETSVAAPPRTRELYRRARLADELGRRSLDLAAAGDARSSAHAAEYFRQAVTWILCAFEEALPPEPSRSATDAALDALWSSPARQRLALVIGDPSVLTAAEPWLLGGSFVRFAELAEPERRERAEKLRGLVRRLLLAVEEPQARVDRVLRRRAVHIGVVLAVLTSVAVLVIFGAERQEARLDLAKGKAWTASSHLMGGCQSPAQSCPESPMYFFHTQEEERPWLVIDLGSKVRFSSLRIQNRSECCAERAVPLAVEVSSDQKRWKEVARREVEFDSWRPAFRTENARYVRLRAMKKTWLHFSSVRVLP
jgi:hypothetical protein